MPDPQRTRRARYSSRPFFVSTFILTLIATYALVVKPLFGVTPGPGPGAGHDGHAFGKRDVGEECRLVHQAPDKCVFVRTNCDDDEAGLFSYLTLYYCTLGNAQPLAFIILVVWLGLLFTTIGIAASDFFSVNLSTIASTLGLSESLAGVTFLAFGNGSPDVFSTFAAMDSNSGSMAVGELIGAAGFITAVVAGSMALVREFKVSRKTYVRDICFFIASVSFAMVFLADGELHLWECCSMIGFYVFYVIVVVGWHWYSTQRRNRRKKEAASRSHFVRGGGGDTTDDLLPYRDEDDDDDDDAAPVGRRNDASAEDISTLERGPRIEVESPRDGSLDEDADDERGLQLTAEMTSSMRINRPRGRRTTTTITPIRPSLVGVLEFRSILASLQKSGNVHLGPINSPHSRSYSNVQPGTLLPESSTPFMEALEDTSPYGRYQSSGRDRALSSGDRPLNLHSQISSAPTIVAQGPSDEQVDLLTGDGAQSPSLRAPSSAVSPKTVPQDEHGRLRPESPGPQKQTRHQPRSHSPSLDIPSPHRLSPSTSPPSTPFPGYSESPRPMSPSGTSPVRHHPHAPSFMLPAPSLERDISFPGMEYPEGLKPVRWWPYKALPPPQIIFGTLFPTLQGWGKKSHWDKFISIVSVPSIFLLVTTLPVVEAESSHDDASDDGMDDSPEPGQPGAMAPPVSMEQDRSIEPETEWQRYRRSTASIRSHSPSSQRSPAIMALDGQSQEHIMQPPSPALLPQAVKPLAPQVVDKLAASIESSGWNRWLVCLQIFTGPLFTVFIIWANLAEDMERPGRVLLKLVLYSLLVSLVLLATLLATTTPQKRPKYHFLLCFLGFIISIAWISTVAGEVVGVLKAFGVIVGISEAILGLTIFAVGNSVGDLVADITVARLGYPVMALSACFGGPMLNILLGVGLGGAWMTIKSANNKHDKHPDHPIHYKPYRIHVSGTLLISAITVLLTLVFLLIAVPSNKWIMSRKIGLSLIAIWVVSTIVNVVVEVTGVGDTMLIVP